jgi:hypothetical protein
MKVEEKFLRQILGAMTQLIHPTNNAIAAATGIYEKCVEGYLAEAENLGFVERIA